MNMQDIIVSLWRGPVNHNGYIGCGVCLKDGWVLTAKHVAEKLVADQTCYAGDIPGRSSGMSIAEIMHHPERDIAVLRLSSSHGKKTVLCNFDSELPNGTEVVLLSYNKAARGVRGPEKTEVLNWTEPGSYDIGKMPVPGMSGGAVLLGDKLVGVIQAEDGTERSGIIIPIRAVQSFLAPYLLAHKNATAVAKDKKVPHEEDESFGKKIAAEIHKELSNREVLTFSEQLGKELNIYSSNVLQDLPMIVERLRKMGVSEAICDCLAPAATSCLVPGKERVEDCRDKAEVILQTAERIMGWLIHGGVDRNKVVFLQSSVLESDLLYFTLGEETLGGVEMVVARTFQRRSEWSGRENPKQCGRLHISIEQKTFSEDDEEEMEKLMLEIWNKVYSKPGMQKSYDDRLTSTEIRQLNAYLRRLRIKRESPEHFYFAFEADRQLGGRVKSLFRKLLKDVGLDEMTVVEFRSSDGHLSTFDEHDVIAAINVFYREVMQQNYEIG